MCVCVCVCTDSFQLKLGSQIDFCVFCTSLRYFWRIPMHMQPKSVSFSSPLACSSCLALKRICCHCHYQYVFLVSPGCVPPSCQIRLLFRCLDSEPNTAVNTVRAKSKHHEVLARSIKKQRCLLCSCERSCSFPIKNGLNAYSKTATVSYGTAAHTML